MIQRRRMVVSAKSHLRHELMVKRAILKYEYLVFDLCKFHCGLKAERSD